MATFKHEPYGGSRGKARVFMGYEPCWGAYDRISTATHCSSEWNCTQFHLSVLACFTLLILFISSSADTLPAMTSRGIPFSPMKKLEGMHTTGSSQRRRVKEQGPSNWHFVSLAVYSSSTGVTNPTCLWIWWNWALCYLDLRAAAPSNLFIFFFFLLLQIHHRRMPPPLQLLR